ncbi:MAG: VCBS repeat-containing protein [Acidobacteria bacterium]|nr:VCBS repeat-containing protein [Acidobacteriota bacterium]
MVATDFNNQRDIDLLVVNYNAPAQLFSNQRDGSFKDVAAPAGLSQSFKALSVAVGDLNKDNFVDLYFPQTSLKDALFLSNGRGGFSRKDMTDDSSSLLAQMTDFDNDGLLDVVLLSGDTIKLRRGLGGELATPLPSPLFLKPPRSGHCPAQTSTVTAAST